MISELFIENQPVDISADLSSLLTFAIDDVKDFASRQTTFSKTIVLPGTDRNNRLFGNIFETGRSNEYNGLLDNIGYNFNASKSARCMMFQDNLQTFKGTIRLLQINKDRGNIEYEVALNGELTNLTIALSSAYLEELDFSAYDHNYTVANIVDSWDNPGGSGYYYPLIDYGNYSVLKHDWSVLTFRPALYVKEYIDKMFEAAGYRYESDLFETARFKSLIIPHNQKKLFNSQTLALDVLGLETTTHTLSDNIVLPNYAILGGFTPGGGDTTFTYSGATINGTIDFAVNIVDSDASAPPFRIGVLINGIEVSYKLVLVGAFPYRLFLPTTNVSIASGDVVSVLITNPFPGARTLQIASAQLTVHSLGNQPVQVNYTDLLKVNGSIPANIKQIDFFSSIIKLFNLYVYESQFDERLIFIKPFVEFYSTDSSNAVDWTYKLNRDQAIRIKPMSEVNSKTYNFKYRDDSDFYNELYRKRYNQGYGSYIFDSEFEFASAANTLELIFASTPLVGYAGEDKIYPTIFKRTGTDASPVEENIDSVIRIMQTKKVTGVTSWDILDDATVLDSVTDYGYAGHFDDPDAPSNDLNFGVTRELFFTLVTGDLTVTQFNVYWSSYMAEICDQDSKMLIGRFYLTPKDIFNLDFSKYVYLDGVLFRLNKITDYNATIPNDCEVEVLRVINTLY